MQYRQVTRHPEVTGDEEPARYHQQEPRHRDFWNPEILKKWAEECQAMKDRYVDKPCKWQGKTYTMLDLVFTEPGLIAWAVLNDDGTTRIVELHKISTP